MVGEELTWKISLPITCPHCDHTEHETFYLNIEDYECRECGEEFRIKLVADNIRVVAEKS